jgi:Nitrile hydratase, alpha chain
MRDGLPVRAQRIHNFSYKLCGARAKGERIMTEPTGGVSRAAVEQRLIDRRLQDESFRQRLHADPRGTMEQELGSRLPESVEVRAVEESADIIYLVLPSASPLGQGRELSDQQLDVVAGGDLNMCEAYTESTSNWPGC